ncbi:MAG TPA: hypothetical protein VGE38_05170 [Nocardioides sp.]|uniref:hypothetical protein n=1 Tax=Nocardioides sp. TaxID=35761 RepID=UPI002ED928AF
MGDIVGDIVIGDRRKPLGRYVRFADDATQDRFAQAAEVRYHELARLDPWSGQVKVELPPEEPPRTVTERRGLLRRAHSYEVPPPRETLLLSAALARAARDGLEVPDRMAALGGCRAGIDLAAGMGEVVVDLAKDLAPVAVPEQQTHPAYRQTLRLAAELRALYDTTAAVGCADPAGCVLARSPGQWGRREEDVEVAEVRTVLAQLAAHTAGHGSPE